ncbi:MAG TPA: HAD-IC family P-type ATPase, partial [Chitinophagaceae bacterium]|nr:HAD-IC family P-type ATPase [Chitinophagaceae bacterium]
MAQNIYNFEGLSAQEVITSREKNGQNILKYKKEHTFLEALKKIFQEPMIILLLVASSVYFISGKTGDGLFMLVAIVFQISISLYQDNRSKHALDKLKNFTQPSCKVIREGIVVSIKNTELVIGDYLVVEEGHAITADGIIVQSNDFSVNESILTGESMAVLKDVNTEDPMIYSGTIVSTGSAIAQITAIGNATRLGKIGLSLASIKEENTPLEIQINHFVKKMALIGTLVFIVFWGINYLHSKQVLNSLLQSLTL